MKYNEIVVVEGMHDLERLKSIYKDIDVLITNGSEIDKYLPAIISALVLMLTLGCIIKNGRIAYAPEDGNMIKDNVVLTAGST